MAKTKHQNGIDETVPKTQSKPNHNHNSKTDCHLDTQKTKVQDQSRNDSISPGPQSKSAATKSCGGKSTPRLVSDLSTNLPNTKAKLTPKSRTLTQELKPGVRHSLLSDAVQKASTRRVHDTHVNKIAASGLEPSKIKSRVKAPKTVGKGETEVHVPNQENHIGGSEKLTVFDNIQQAISALPKHQRSRTPIVCIRDCLKSGSDLERSGSFESLSENSESTSTAVFDTIRARSETSELNQNKSNKDNNVSRKEISVAELEKLNLVSENQKMENSLSVNSLLVEDKVVKGRKSKGEKEKPSPRQKKKNVVSGVEDTGGKQPHKKTVKNKLNESVCDQSENSPEKKGRRKAKVKEAAEKVCVTEPIKVVVDSKECSLYTDSKSKSSTVSEYKQPGESVSGSSLSPTKEADLRLGRRIRSPSVRYADDMILFPLKSPRRSRSPKGSAEKEAHPAVHSGIETDEKVNGNVSNGSSPDEKSPRTAECQTSHLYSLLTQEKIVKESTSSLGETEAVAEVSDSKGKGKKKGKKESESTTPPVNKSPKGKRKNSSGKDSSEKKSDKLKNKVDEKPQTSPTSAVRELKFEKEKNGKQTENLDADVVNLSMEINGKGKKIELTVPKTCKAISEPVTTANSLLNHSDLSSKHRTRQNDACNTTNNKKPDSLTSTKSDKEEDSSDKKEVSSNHKSLGLFDLIAKVKSNMNSTQNLPGLMDSSSYCDLVDETEEGEIHKGEELLNSSDKSVLHPDAKDEKKEIGNKTENESDSASDKINDDFFSEDFLQAKNAHKTKSPKKENCLIENDVNIPISSADVILVDQATSSSMDNSEISPSEQQRKERDSQKVDVASTVTMDTEVGSTNVDSTVDNLEEGKEEALTIDIQERRNIFDAIMNDYHSPKSDSAVKWDKEEKDPMHTTMERSKLKDGEKDGKVGEKEKVLKSENSDPNNKQCVEKGNGISITPPKSIIEKIQEKLRLTLDDSPMRSTNKTKVINSVDNQSKLISDLYPSDKILKEETKEVTSDENVNKANTETMDFEIVMDMVDEHQDIPEFDEQIDNSAEPPSTQPCVCEPEIVTPKSPSPTVTRPIPKMSTKRQTVEPRPLSVLSNVETTVKDQRCAFLSEKLDSYLKVVLGKEVLDRSPTTRPMKEEEFMEQSEDSSENFMGDEEASGDIPDDTGDGTHPVNAFSPIIADCDPDFDEVDGILFVSFPNEEALEAHIKVEKKTKIGKNEQLLLGMARMKNLRQKQRQIQSTVHKKKWARLKALKAQYKIHQSLQGMHLVLGKYQRIYRKELILTLMAKEQADPGSVQIKKPTKTSDVTKIKGWKSKFQNIQSGLPSDFELQPSKKLHWRTEESLVKNLRPQELREMGLDLKKKRRKNLIFTKRKGMSKGDGSKMERADEDLMDEEEVGVIQNGLDNEESNGVEFSQGIVEMGNEILDFDRQKNREKKQRDRYKRYLMMKLRMTIEDIDILKKLGGQRLRILKPAGSSFGDVDLPEKKAEDMEAGDGEDVEGDFKNSEKRKRRKRKKNLFQIITLTNSMSNAALSALDPRFVKKKKKRPKTVEPTEAIDLTDRQSRPQSPSKGGKSQETSATSSKSPTDSMLTSPGAGTKGKQGLEGDFDKNCDKPGCRYGCICHLCKFGDASPEADSPSNHEKPKCTKEYCRLGCICESSDQSRENEHCGKPECMFECKCGPSQRQGDSRRGSVSSNDSFQTGSVERRGRRESGMSSKDDPDFSIDGDKGDDKRKCNNKKNQDRYAGLPKRTSTYRLAKNLDAVSRKALLEYETSEKYAEIKSNKPRSEKGADVKSKVRKRQDSQEGQPVQTKVTVAPAPQVKVAPFRSTSTLKDCLKLDSSVVSSSSPNLMQKVVVSKSKPEPLMKKHFKPDDDLHLFDSESEVDEISEDLLPNHPFCARTSIYTPIRGRVVKECTCGQYHLQQDKAHKVKEPTSSKETSSPICISPVQSRDGSPVPPLSNSTVSKAEDFTPVSGWHTQWVCLKNNKKIADTGYSCVRLLEIMSNCNWDGFKQKILSMISAQIQEDSYPEPKTLFHDDFIIKFLEKSDKPAVIPPQVQATLPPAIYSVRVKVSKRSHLVPNSENSVATSKLSQQGSDNKNIPQTIATSTGVTRGGISGLSLLQINRGAASVVKRDSPPVCSDMSYWSNKSTTPLTKDSALFSSNNTGPKHVLTGPDLVRSNIVTTGLSVSSTVHTPSSSSSPSVQQMTKPISGMTTGHLRKMPEGVAITEPSLLHHNLTSALGSQVDKNKSDRVSPGVMTSSTVTCTSQSESVAILASQNTYVTTAYAAPEVSHSNTYSNSNAVNTYTTSLPLQSSTTPNVDSSVSSLSHCSIPSMTTSVQASINVTASASDLIMTNSVIDNRPIVNNGFNKNACSKLVRTSSEEKSSAVSSRPEDKASERQDIKISPLKHSPNASCRNKVERAQKENTELGKITLQSPAIINAVVSSPLKNTAIGLKPAITTLQEKKCIIGPMSTPVTLIGPFDSPANIPMTLPQMKILQAKSVAKDGKPVLHLVPLQGNPSAAKTGLIPISISLTSGGNGNGNSQPLNVTAMKSAHSTSVCSSVSGMSSKSRVTTTTSVSTVCSLFSVSEIDAMSKSDIVVTSSATTQRTSTEISQTSSRIPNVVAPQEQADILPTAGDQILVVSRNERKDNSSSVHTKGKQSLEETKALKSGTKRKIDYDVCEIDGSEAVRSKKTKVEAVKSDEDENIAIKPCNEVTKETDSVLAKLLLSTEHEREYVQSRNIRTGDVANPSDPQTDGKIEDGSLEMSNEQSEKEDRQRNIQDVLGSSTKECSDMKVDDVDGDFLNVSGAAENGGTLVGGTLDNNNSSITNSGETPARPPAKSRNKSVAEDDSDFEMNDEVHSAPGDGSELDSSCDNKSDDTDATVVGGIEAECKDLDSEQSNMGMDELCNEPGSDNAKGEEKVGEEETSDVNSSDNVGNPETIHQQKFSSSPVNENRSGTSDHLASLTESSSKKYASSVQKKQDALDERKDETVTEDVICILDSPEKKIRHQVFSSKNKNSDPVVIEIDDENEEDLVSRSKSHGHNERNKQVSSEKTKSDSINTSKLSEGGTVDGSQAQVNGKRQMTDGISHDASQPSCAKKMRINSGSSGTTRGDSPTQSSSSLCIAIDDSDDVAVVIPNDNNKKCVEIIDSDEEEVDIETVSKDNTTKLLQEQMENIKDALSPQCSVHGFSMHRQKSPVSSNTKRKPFLKAICNDDVGLEFREGYVVTPIDNKTRVRSPSLHKAREKQRRMALQVGFRKLAIAMYGQDDQNSRYTYLLTHSEPRIQLLGRARQTIEHLKDLEKRFIIAHQTWTARNLLLKCQLSKLKDFMIEKRKMPWMVLQAHLDKISKVCCKIFMNMPAILKKRAAERQKITDGSAATGSSPPLGQEVSPKSRYLQSQMASAELNKQKSVAKTKPAHTSNKPVPVQLVTSQQVKQMAESNKARGQSKTGKRPRKQTYSNNPDIYIDYAEEEFYQDFVEKQEENYNGGNIKEETMLDDIGDLPRIMNCKGFNSEGDNQYAMGAELEDDRDILDEVTGELIHITDNESQESLEEGDGVKSVTTYQMNHQMQSSHNVNNAKSGHFIQVSKNRSGSVVEVSMSDKGEIRSMHRGGEMRMNRPKPSYHSADLDVNKTNENSDQMLVISDVKSLSFDEL